MDNALFFNCSGNGRESNTVIIKIYEDNCGIFSEMCDNTNKAIEIIVK